MSQSIPYFRPATQAQGLANYPHARTVQSADGKGSYVYVSGTSSRRGNGTFVGATPAADGTIAFDIRQQTAAVLSNIDAIIKGASDGRAGIHDTVDATVFLTNMTDDYTGMNSEWNKIWPDRNTAPARTTVEVRALPREEIIVEIKCTVYYV
jgi:enamine deaminase RidA (YjgF/YER057c/UK114 family)